MTLKQLGVLALAVALALSAAAIAAPPQAPVPQSMAQVQLSFAPVVKRVAPAVVNVYARSIVRQQVNPVFNDPLFQQFFGVCRNCASASSSRWARA